MEKFAVGQAVRRREDERFLTGGGQYLDDIVLDNMCHAAVVRSPHAHAKIKKIDTSRAEKMKGVKAVITCDDLPRPGLPLGDGPLPEVMVDDGAGGLIPDTVAHCAGLNGVRVYAADAPHRFRVSGPVEPVSPFEPAPSGELGPV